MLLSLLILLLIVGCKSQQTNSNAKSWKSDRSNRTSPIKAGALEDDNLRFVGRWDFSNSNSFVSHWGGAYIKTRFSGTSVKMIVGHASNFFAKIDGGPWISYLNKKDTVNLSDQPLTTGWHTLTVAQGKDYDYIFDFKGFILDETARTKAPRIAPVLIEYIGDSITTGYTDTQANVSDYGWIAAEILGAEHTQIAYPGINLVSGYGRVKGNGMDIQYLKAQSLKNPNAPEWDFRKYAAHIVTINLGTNDNNNKVPDSVFTRSYVSLIKNIRQKFPKAKIFAMRTFLGIKQQATIEAVNQIKNGGDKNVFYLDTSGWITAKTSDYNDTAHPSISGQEKAGKLLAEKLKPYLNN